MNVNELTLGQIKELQSVVGCVKPTRARRPDPDAGKYVIVRTYSAGVHCGILESRNGIEVRLTQARRIWNWQSDAVKRFTLHEVSVSGVAAASKISQQIDAITLTEAIEVIPCSAAAEKNLRGAPWTA